MLGPKRDSGGGVRRHGLEVKSPLGKALGRLSLTPYGVLALSGGLALTTLTLVMIVFQMPRAPGGSSSSSSSMTVLEKDGGGDDTPGRDIHTLNEHIYTEADLPFFNETVAEYRRRLRPKLARTRPGTIFVAISSFRDNFCQDTLRNLFGTARDPGRVFVGVVDQMKPWDQPLGVNETLDIPCEGQLDLRTQAQVRLVRLHYKSSRGPTHARYISSKLWDGEDVFLQIDAHANFLPGWDQELLDNIAAMPDPDRAILSHYPAPEARDLGRNVRQWNCKVTTEWAPPGLLYQIPDWCRPENMAEGVALDPDGRKTTCYSPFIGAGFLAGRARMLYDAPYDRYLPYLFHGEEILIGARLWTSGWDLFTPRLNLVTHRYGERRHNVYAETPNWDVPARRSEARARLLLGSRVPADDEIDAEIDRRELDDLGMGTVRSLGQYLEYAGVDWTVNPPVLQSRCSMRYDGEKWIPVPTSDPA